MEEALSGLRLGITELYLQGQVIHFYFVLLRSRELEKAVELEGGQ